MAVMKVDDIRAGSGGSGNASAVVKKAMQDNSAIQNQRWKEIQEAQNPYVPPVSPRSNDVGQVADFSGLDVYGAMMDFLGNLSNKWDSFINNWTKKGKDENAMNMAYALRQHEKVYNPENNNGQGLSKLMDIYNTKAKNDRSVEDTASEMAMNKNSSLYNNAFNLVNSAGANGMTADQIRKLYSRF